MHGDCPLKVDAADEHAHMPRRGERLPVEQRATALSCADDCYEVRVQNLSSYGFMAACLGPVPIGSYVSIEIAGIGPVEAQVRWQIGPKLGGMFLEPITLASCEWSAAEAG